MPPPRRLIHPPTAVTIAILAMLALHHFAPGPRWIHHPWNYLGIVAILLGLPIGASGAFLFRRRRTGVVPFSPATQMVTAGPYRFTRNPMYLGLTLCLTGLAIFLGTATPFIIIPLFIWWITARFIVHEERFLTDTFGQPYLDYRRRVRRWL